MISVVAAGAFAFYLLAANVLIGSRLLRSIIHEDPDSLSVEYASAWTLWPGRVRIRGFRIQDRGVGTEWSVALDEGRASIGLLDLLRRRFHCTRIRGTGLVIRVRTRVPPDEATPHRLAFIPPIPGYADPPLREVGRNPSPPTGREWTVRLEDVAVDGVREIWVDDYRYAGGATLVGGMLLYPKRSFEMFQSSLDVHTGALEFRGDTVVASVLARLDARVHPYDLQVWRGSGILRFMTGAGKAAGAIEDVRFLNELVHVPASVRLDEGTGTLAAEMSLDRGEGSGALDLAAKGVRATMRGTVMRGDAESRMIMRRLDLVTGHVDFSGSHLEIHDVLVHGKDEEPQPWGARVDLLSGDLRTDRPRIFDTRLAVRADNARPLYKLLGLNLRSFTERILKLEKLEATADLAIAESFVDLKSLEARGSAFHVLGRYRFQKPARGTGQGEFLLTSGPFALGVGLLNGETDYRVFRPRTWYRKQATPHAGG